MNAQEALPKEAVFQEELVHYRALLDLYAMEGLVGLLGLLLTSPWHLAPKMRD